MSSMTDGSVMLHARDAIRRLRASKIREVANAGMGRKDVLAFWFGEPDEVTPEFIRQAGIDALNAGETFYTQNLGIPELRHAIAAYVSRLHRTVRDERIAVTNSGMSALMIVTQALIGPGDRVVAVTPLWPNLVEIPKILGADVECIPLDFGPAGWSLNVGRLLHLLTPATRAVYINAPNNPTGWTMGAPDQRAILEHCRKHGIWIIADDAYERLYYGGGPAPSFLDLGESEDRLVSTNTFSKSWLMTGWRLGWIVAPEELMSDLAKLLEYNTSCAPPFIQRAGVVAITQGEDVVAHTVERFRRARDFLAPGYRRSPGSKRLPLRVPCTRSFVSPASPTVSLSADAWLRRPAWDWHRAWHLDRKVKASCAGALPRAKFALPRVPTGCRTGLRDPAPRGHRVTRHRR